MKVTTDHLEKVRTLLGAASEQLAVQTKAAKEAEEARLATVERVRALQGSFDILAASFASDAELSSAQLAALPAAVQSGIGYVPAAAVA
jgi:hypothetical protein